MNTKSQLDETTLDELQNKESGVTELMEFYERVEAIYIDASMSVSDADIVHTVVSSNLVRDYAHLG